MPINRDVEIMSPGLQCCLKGVKEIRVMISGPGVLWVTLKNRKDLLVYGKRNPETLWGVDIEDGTAWVSILRI